MSQDVMTPAEPTGPDEKEREIKRAILLSQMLSELAESEISARKVAVAMKLREVSEDVRAQAEERLGEKPAGATTDSTSDAPNPQGRTGGASGRRSIYLVGHGIFVLSNSVFKVPANTSVRFYTIAGRKMMQGDALKIVAGTLDARTEELFEAGESCPNMTLQSERDDPPLPENANAGQRARWMSAAQMKKENDDNAQAARACGDDIFQVDEDTSLESIVLGKPGFDYAWTCCYDQQLNEIDASQSPVSGASLGRVVPSLQGGGKKLGTFDRVGEAGGWDEVRSRRTTFSNVVGRIETVEMLESGKALALQVLLTDETQMVRGRFRSYTVFVKTDILEKNPYFGSIPPETFRQLAANRFDSLQGKKLTMERAKIFDKAQRSLQLEQPGEFTISE